MLKCTQFASRDIHTLPPTITFHVLRQNLNLPPGVWVAKFAEASNESPAWCLAEMGDCNAEIRLRLDDDQQTRFGAW